MNLLTAESFAAGNGSYWSAVLPRLDHFVRISNAGPREFAAPIAMPDTRRQSFVSETAFYLCAQYASSAVKPDFQQAQARARSRLRQLAPHLRLEEPLTTDERLFALVLAQRLNAFCSESRSLRSVQIERRLPGCGWISGGLPDLIAIDESHGHSLTYLAEVKCVDRTFRSADMRQLVSYIVLYYSEFRRLPDLIGVINPLRGTALEIGVDEFFEDVVGSASSDVVNELLVEWSSAGVSP